MVPDTLELYTIFELCLRSEDWSRGPLFPQAPLSVLLLWPRPASVPRVRRSEARPGRPRARQGRESHSCRGPPGSCTLWRLRRRAPSRCTWCPLPGRTPGSELKDRHAHATFRAGSHRVCVQHIILWCTVSWKWIQFNSSTQYFVCTIARAKRICFCCESLATL